MKTTTILLCIAYGLGAACGGGGGGGGGGAGPPPPPPAWRSALYPADWTPGFADAAGRFLHDFSFAGYRNGEAPIPDIAGPLFDAVAGHGADPAGSTDATASIQAAIDAAAAAGGGVVLLPKGLYRVDGVLTVTASGVVLRGEGPDSSRLAFTRFPDMSYRSHLMIRGAPVTGGEFPLAADAAPLDRVVSVPDAVSLAVGDDVDVGFTITPEFVAEHGMDGTWTAFNGTWQPFFRREVVAIDLSSSPHRVTLDVPLRYPAKVRDGASLRVVRGLLSGAGVERLGLSNAVAEDAAWSLNQVHALELADVKDCWVRDVRSFASPFGPPAGAEPAPHLQSSGIMVRSAKRVTVRDCALSYAQNRGGGGNGYLYELRQSSEILFADCLGRRGRHNFIQNWGFGVSGCVFLRCESREGEALNDVLGFLVPTTGYSEYHHSLATANLVDSSVTGDGWSAINRGTESTGAGHTATQCVFWNTTGTGRVRSGQFGAGFVIGTGADTRVTILGDDFVEGQSLAADLLPRSLYEDQLARRIARGD